MSEITVSGFDFDSDLDRVAELADAMLGDRLDEDGNERWKVVVNPSELDMNTGVTIVTVRARPQFFVVDSQPYENRTTFREVICSRSGENPDLFEVHGVSGRTYTGGRADREQVAALDIGKFTIGTGKPNPNNGGQIFWD